MIKLFQQIVDWIPDKHGWTTVEKAHAFVNCILALRPETVVEIGVWGGRSLIPVAMALKFIGRGTIIGIDPFSAEASIQGMNGAHYEWWNNQENHDLVYEDLLKQIRETGVQNSVRIIRATSDSVEVPVRIDYLSIDGNHGAQAVRDVERFAPRVRVGGFCYLDDLDWEGGAVETSATKLESLGFIRLFSIEKGAMFQRVNKL